MAVFEQVRGDRYPLHAVVARTLIGWLLILMALILGFWLINRSQGILLHDLIRAEERALLDRGAGILANELRLPIIDLPYLVEHQALRNWAASADDGFTTEVRDSAQALARHRPSYAEILLFDVQGSERIRVSQNSKGERSKGESPKGERPKGERLPVPTEAPQDKSHHTSPRDQLALPAASIHIDTGVEPGPNGGSVQPMLRFAAPVIDADGQARGALAIHHHLQGLFNRLTSLTPHTQGQGMWLLDPEGNWWLGEPRKEAAGSVSGNATVVGDRASGGGQRFRDHHAKAWLQMDATAIGETGQALVDGDLFTWRRVAAPAPAMGWTLIGPGATGWRLISRVPGDTLAAASATLRQPLWGWLAALALGALGLAFAAAHHQERRRQHLAAVEASEARFQKLLEAAPDAVIIVDDGGLIRLANARAVDWFRYETSELLGRPVEILLPEALREGHQRHRSAYLAMPRARDMGVGTPLSARRRDGSEFPVEISLSPITIGEHQLVIAVVRDITERRSLEQAREEAQERYRRLLDNLPLGVFRSSMSERLADDRRFLEVNPALVVMFEAENAEHLLARPPASLYHDAGERAVFVAELFALGAVVGRELRMVTLKGRVFDARLSAVLRRDLTGNRFVDGVIEDVSSRRAAERERDRIHGELQHRAAALEAANRELDAFSYSVSHDLRAPLRAMDGFSRILEQEYGAQLDARGRDYLVRVRNAARHMAALIDDLLKLSRVTRTELRPEPIDLSLLAQELLTELQHGDPQRSVDCVIQPELRALGDARLLRVALANLLENAWKFTVQTAVATIQFGAREQEGEQVFYVRDNGAGFDMAYADKLFGAFQRLHHAQDFSGTGIGLATAQRVILKHGGRIWAEAAVGQGAVFYFTLETASTARGERIAGNRAFGTAREADHAREIS